VCRSSVKGFASRRSGTDAATHGELKLSKKDKPGISCRHPFIRTLLFRFGLLSFVATESARFSHLCCF